MIFKCRNCHKTSADIDMVLDGACDCGCANFELVSQESFIPGEMTDPREAIRRDLHMWVDMNIDNLEVKNLQNMRVRLEFGEEPELY